MNNYTLLTDVTCDLDAQTYDSYGIVCIPMGFRLGDREYTHYADEREISTVEFYERLKVGEMPSTTQINPVVYQEYFEASLKEGKDVCYLCFSSGLSGTYNTCMIAVKELEEEYPDRKIVVLDSRCDSAGLGLLVYLAGKKYKEGASIEELEQFIIDTRDNIAHWFVVEDLDQLKRGGRISSVSAAFGKALQIKPLISCDENGKLVSVGKIRGTSNVIPTMAKHVERDAIDPKKNIAFIAHADNPDGAKALRKAIKGMFKEVIITTVGPVIGSHVGSGMLAVVFKGKRNLVS